METIYILILTGSLCFACGTLLYLLHKERELKKLITEERYKNTTFAKMLHQMDDQLTSVKWHTEMLLDQDNGKLNIAQQQLLHKVDTSVADAIALLKKHLNITSKEL